MRKTSSLNIYRNINSLENSLKEQWEKAINIKEHLKLEYPDGIPMKVLYHSGIFEENFIAGRYKFDENGECFIFSPEIDGCLINGNREVPLVWYLLFTEENNYSINIEKAFLNYQTNIDKLEKILEQKSKGFKDATKYFLNQCNQKQLLAFKNFFFQEDKQGFVELAYADFGISIKPIVTDRINEDKKKLLFPKEIQVGLDLLLKKEYSKANSILVEITSIHRELTSSTINHF